MSSTLNPIVLIRIADATHTGSKFTLVNQNVSCVIETIQMTLAEGTAATFLSADFIKIPNMSPI